MPLPLLKLLRRAYPESKTSTLRQMIDDRRVIVDGVLARTANQIVNESATLEVGPRPREGISIDVPTVYEDDDLIVFNKPPSLLTSSGPRDKRPTLIGMLRERIPDAGLIHRLDADASGLIVFSFNKQAYESLKRQFFDRSATRQYLAICDGTPKPREGTRESWLVEYHDGTVHETRNRAKGDRAVTHYQTIETVKKRSMIRCRLESGRKHQIRVHLAALGCPIAGDRLYHPKPHEAPRLMLLAERLELIHPRTGEPLVLEVEVPQVMRDWWGSKR